MSNKSTPSSQYKAQKAQKEQEQNAQIELEDNIKIIEAEQLKIEAEELLKEAEKLANEARDKLARSADIIILTKKPPEMLLQGISQAASRREVLSSKVKA